MPFPNTIHYSWPIGFPGGIASANPTRTVITGPNPLRAASGGVSIAAFAWIESDGVSVSNAQPSASTTTPPAGFVLRDQNSLITGYLASNTMILPEGFAVPLMSGGDFFAVATTEAAAGQAVYASTTTGAISTAAADSAPTGTIATGWVVSQGGAAGDVIIISGPVAPSAAASTSSSSSSST